MLGGCEEGLSEEARESRDGEGGKERQQGRRHEGRMSGHHMC